MWYVALPVWLAWLLGMASGGRWGLFEHGSFMSVTMMFGSFIAGATSEGGGAVAFPVMTLVFEIEPAVARDFSLMIQAVGMTAAAITILRLRIKVVGRAIVLAGLGGGLGVIVSLEAIAPNVPPAYAKMFFTSLWLSFAAALWWINRERGRAVFDDIPEANGPSSALLLGVGFIGGQITGVLGSGLDIITFAVLVLGFHVSESVATPTSVVLMASNAVVGALWKGTLGAGLEAAAWSYWWVCVPIVVVGAPAGAWFIRNRSRSAIALFLIASIVIQFVAALVIIEQTPSLLAFSASTILAGLLLFAGVARAGRWRLGELPAGAISATR